MSSWIFLIMATCMLRSRSVFINIDEYIMTNSNFYPTCEKKYLVKGALHKPIL